MNKFPISKTAHNAIANHKKIKYDKIPSGIDLNTLLSKRSTVVLDEIGKFLVALSECQRHPTRDKRVSLDNRISNLRLALNLLESVCIDEILEMNNEQEENGN